MPATPKPKPGSGRPGLTLPRRRILRERPLFDATFAKGKRFHNRCLTLLIVPAEAITPDKGEVAFLTPKRLGDAVIRNRLRRRLREAYRLHQNEFAAAPNSDHRLIWLAKGPAIALDFKALIAQMKELYARSLAS